MECLTVKNAQCEHTHLASIMTLSGGERRGAKVPPQLMCQRIIRAHEHEVLGRGGGGQARIKLTAIYSLSGTNQSTSKVQDGALVSRKQYNRLVAHAGRHSSHRTLPLGEHSGYSVYHCGDLR